ncbi:hypothetical protein BKI52_03670 [marine bacterium AO1-C]|nr:hypothetical protein BKI52_03670 [marine bacterium AO1-C]
MKNLMNSNFVKLSNTELSNVKGGSAPSNTKDKKYKGPYTIEPMLPPVDNVDHVDAHIID